MKNYWSTRSNAKTLDLVEKH